MNILKLYLKIAILALFVTLSVNWIFTSTAKAGRVEVSKLYLTTTYIEIFAGDSKVGTGTGFFCKSADHKKLFLITNRHIVIDEKEQIIPDTLKLKLHTDKNNLRRSEDYNINLYYDRAKTHRRWREIGPSIDVVAIQLPIAKMNKYYYEAFSPDQFANDQTALGIGEPVVIIGYPLGFFDDINNLPIAIEGAIASAYPIPFKNNQFFLVDANLYPGNSGSPVLSRPSQTRLLSDGSMESTNEPNAFFYVLGINSGTYFKYNNDLKLNTIWFSSVIQQLIQ